MGRFLEKLMAAPEVKPLLSDEHFSVDGTLLRRLGRPMPRWSGSTERTIHHLRRQALVRVLELQSRARSEPKGISAASSSATRPIAPARIPMPY
jgi:hypothetical protein